MTIDAEIRVALLAEADADYKTFHASLLPTVDPARIIGVRMPMQRKIAKAFAGDGRVPGYLAMQAHDFYEEVNIHGFFISALKDFDETLAQTNAFLPQIDNWGNCDSFSPRAFKRDPARLREVVPAWLDDAAHPYTVRFGINMLMQHCLGDCFEPQDLAAVAACACDEYYVNMGVAWYFSMALVKQWDQTLPWIVERRMPDWVHRKSIQKAVESRRIAPERKALLKNYR